MFQPHRNLSNRINGDLIRSEIEGGVYLRDLPDHATLEIVTQNRPYMLTVRRDGSAWISGHPQFCPEPVRVRIAGSNWGGSMLKLQYLGRGMQLEFEHPGYHTPIVTSAIVDIRVRTPA